MAMPTATPEPTQTATPPPTATATTAPASTGFIRILDVEAPAQVPAGMVFGVTVRYQWAFDGAGEVRIRGSFDNPDIPFLTRSVQSAGESSEYLDKFALYQPGQHTLVVELYGSSGGGSELMDRRELTVEVTEAVPSATPTSDVPAPSGGQSRSDRDIYDDFSAETFSWCVGADEIAISGYEDGAYFMHTLQPQYRTLCFLPVTFFPTTAEFDAWVPQGFRGGTFGLACHFQSMDDFYSVEIDLGSGSLYVRQRAGGESYPLTDPEWIDLSYLKPTPTETNHVMVACDPDLITVWINYSLEAQVSLASLAEPGDMALFVKGWEDMEPEGYKVLFDNFVAWKPVQ